MSPPLAIASATLLASTITVVTTSEMTLLPRRLLISETIRPKRTAIKTMDPNHKELHRETDHAEEDGQGK